MDELQNHNAEPMSSAERSRKYRINRKRKLESNKQLQDKEREIKKIQKQRERINLSNSSKFARSYKQKQYRLKAKSLGSSTVSNESETSRISSVLLNPFSTSNAAGKAVAKVKKNLSEKRGT